MIFMCYFIFITRPPISLFCSIVYLLNAKDQHEACLEMNIKLQHVFEISIKCGDIEGLDNRIRINLQLKLLLVTLL